jgi:putative membrane protein
MARIAEPLSARISSGAMRAACRLAVRRIDLRAEGLDHLPRAGAVILAARHYHHLWDGCALVAVSPRHLHLVVALDWIRNPVLDRLMRGACRAAGWPVLTRPDRPPHPCGPAAAERLAADLPELLAATRASVSLLRAGRAVVLFPEGYPTVDPSYTPKTADDEFLPFRPGYLRFAGIAARDGGIEVPIVPVGLEYRRGHRWRLTVRFGAPVRFAPGVDRAELATTVEDAVRRLSGQPGIT